MLKINKDDLKPLHIQLYEELKQSILNTMKAGEKLPSIRKIALIYNISKITVENAYSQLVVEGYIESIPKSGFFVSEDLYNSATLVQTKNIEEKKELEYLYDFYPLRLSADTFPLKIWKRVYNKVINESLHLGKYQDGQGEFGLRKEISKYLNESRGVNCNPSSVVICSGFPNAASLIARLLKTEHKRLAMENPGYYVVKGVFEDYGYKIDKIPIQKNGLDIKFLENSNSKIVYITPSHQYPTGVTTPISKRIKLLEWAEKNQGFIIEDDYDSELSFVNKPIPSMQGLDKNQRVIYMGTFAKSFSPAIRVSYVVLPSLLIEKYNLLYDSSISRVDLTLQKTLEEFMTKGYWDKHLRKIRTINKKKHNLMKKSIEKYLGDYVNIISEGAGLNINIYPKTSFDWEKFKNLGEKNKIKLYFASDISGGDWEASRLGFGGLQENDIENAIKAFSKIWIESII